MLTVTDKLIAILEVSRHCAFSEYGVNDGYEFAFEQAAGAKQVTSGEAWSRRDQP